MTTRLDRLRDMRDWIDTEIAAAIAPVSRDIVADTAALYGVSPADVLGGSRKADVTKARQGSAWLLRRTGMSLHEIGRALGCDHTTVLHACRRVDASPSVRALLVGLEVVA